MKVPPNFSSPFTIWLTGLPCSGKSTIASLLKQQLFDRYFLQSVILDGDQLRSGLSKDLDFSVAGRTENNRRAVEVCKLIMDAGLIAISAIVSPIEKERTWARKYLGENKFILVYLNSPLNVCRKRDVKGLYQKAQTGDIKNFTGINSPYDVPNNAHLTLETHRMSPSTCIERILNSIETFQMTSVQHQSYIR